MKPGRMPPSRGESRICSPHRCDRWPAGDLRPKAEKRSSISPRDGGILPGFIDYYGHTKMALELTVSEHGIDRIGKLARRDVDRVRRSAP